MGTYSRNTGGDSGAFQGHRLRRRPGGKAQLSAGTRGHRQRETESERAGDAGLRQLGLEAGARPPGGGTRRAARRGEKAAVGSAALIGRAGGVGSGATRHRAEPAPRGARGAGGGYSPGAAGGQGHGHPHHPGPRRATGRRCGGHPPCCGPGRVQVRAGWGCARGRLPSLAGTVASAGGFL